MESWQNRKLTGCFFFFMLVKKLTSITSVKCSKMQLEVKQDKGESNHWLWLVYNIGKFEWHVTKVEWGGEKPFYFCIQFALYRASHSSAQMVSCLRERVYALQSPEQQEIAHSCPTSQKHPQWKSWQVGASRIFVQWWSLENSVDPVQCCWFLLKWLRYYPTRTLAT